MSTKKLNRPLCIASSLDKPSGWQTGGAGSSQESGFQHTTNVIYINLERSKMGISTSIRLHSETCHAESATHSKLSRGFLVGGAGSCASSLGFGIFLVDVHRSSCENFLVKLRKSTQSSNWCSAFSVLQTIGWRKKERSKRETINLHQIHYSQDVLCVLRKKFIGNCKNILIIQAS